MVQVKLQSRLAIMEGVWNVGLVVNSIGIVTELGLMAVIA
jgi:hypothetical protein